MGIASCKVKKDPRFVKQAKKIVTFEQLKDFENYYKQGFQSEDVLC